MTRSDLQQQQQQQFLLLWLALSIADALPHPVALAFVVAPVEASAFPLLLASCCSRAAVAPPSNDAAVDVVSASCCRLPSL